MSRRPSSSRSHLRKKKEIIKPSRLPHRASVFHLSFLAFVLSFLLSTRICIIFLDNYPRPIYVSFTFITLKLIFFLLSSLPRLALRSFSFLLVRKAFVIASRLTRGRSLVVNMVARCRGKRSRFFTSYKIIRAQLDTWLRRALRKPSAYQSRTCQSGESSLIARKKTLMISWANYKPWMTYPEAHRVPSLTRNYEKKKQNKTYSNPTSRENKQKHISVTLSFEPIDDRICVSASREEALRGRGGPDPYPYISKTRYQSYTAFPFTSYHSIFFFPTIFVYSLNNRRRLATERCEMLFDFPVAPNIWKTPYPDSQTFARCSRRGAFLPSPWKRSKRKQKREKESERGGERYAVPGGT